MAACDLAVAAEDAAFATPGVKIGLFCTTPMVALTRAIGRKRALQMLLTGEIIAARTAADWGLINQVVPAAELHAATRQMAAKVAESSPLALALGKQAFYTQIDLDQPKAYAYAKEVMSMNALAADAQEGMSAFWPSVLPAGPASNGSEPAGAGPSGAGGFACQPHFWPSVLPADRQVTAPNRPALAKVGQAVSPANRISGRASSLLDRQVTAPNRPVPANVGQAVSPANRWRTAPPQILMGSYRCCSEKAYGELSMLFRKNRPGIVIVSGPGFSRAAKSLFCGALASALRSVQALKPNLFRDLRHG